MKSAVIVIDVQRVLFEPKPQPYDCIAVLSNINAVTHWARKMQYPVVFVQHESINSAIEFGSDGWQLHTDLVVDEFDILVRKTTPDSFLNTNLDKVLKQLDVNHLIVCGYASEFCIDTTVRRAAGLGYSIDIIADAHTTHDKSHATAQQIRTHHNATLPNISSFGVKISAISTEQLTSTLT